MSKVYIGVNVNELKSEELARMVSNVQALAGDGYEILHKNYEPFMTPFKKILKLSKQEKEWYLYFSTMYEILYLSSVHDQYDEIVKYAELYYKESELYMDRELPNYPDTDMAFMNTWIYGYIFEAYYYYHQIDDAKMDAFMKKYERDALKYGKTYNYYEDAIKLSVLYRDAEGAKEAARGFRRYEKDLKSCYVCGHKPYLESLLLTGENRQAEEMLLDLVNQNIPKQHLWCYKHCRSAVPEALYGFVLKSCIQCGNEEAFRFFFKKYWKKLPYESQWESDAYTFKRLLCALSGYFKEYKDDIREAEEDIKEERHDTTLGNATLALEWWCYFNLLDANGVHEVEINLPGLVSSGSKKIPSLVVAEYMEKRADELGALFSRARSRFDYAGLKESYRNCFISGKK